MIDCKDLMINNWVSFEGELWQINMIDFASEIVDLFNGNHATSVSAEFIEALPLTPELLIDLGAIKSVIENPFFMHYDFDFGRDRHVSVSNPGTPNEFVMLVERDKEKIPSVICIRNYDYDGKTYLHQLQNIFHSLSGGKELNYTPKQ